MAEPPLLVLASQSRSRREMLAGAGLAFVVEPSGGDEGALRASFEADRALDEDYPVDVAELLASQKACRVSRNRHGAIVIGADQVLALRTERSMRVGTSDFKASAFELFEKPGSLAEAREQLLRLRGRTHELFSAVVLAENGKVTWTYVESAELTMRNFSDAFLDHYLKVAGTKVCESVGAYQLEGPGVQLFEAVDGDYFTILGLPLLALLEELRARGVIPS